MDSGYMAENMALTSLFRGKLNCLVDSTRAVRRHAMFFYFFYFGVRGHNGFPLSGILSLC